MLVLPLCLNFQLHRATLHGGSRILRNKPRLVHPSTTNMYISGFTWSYGQSPSHPLSYTSDIQSPIPLNEPSTPSFGPTEGMLQEPITPTSTSSTTPGADTHYPSVGSWDWRLSQPVLISSRRRVDNARRGPPPSYVNGTQDILKRKRLNKHTNSAWSR